MENRENFGQPRLSQKAVIHGDIVVFPLNVGPTGFAHRRNWVKLLLPVIFGQWNSRVPAQTSARAWVSSAFMTERPYFPECVEHKTIERLRFVFITQLFQNDRLGAVFKDVQHLPSSDQSGKLTTDHPKTP